MAKRRKEPVPAAPPPQQARALRPELVVITGVSGSGKGTVLKALEDLGYHAVDNMPVALLETFASLVKESSSVRRAALVVDIREGDLLSQFPGNYSRIRNILPTCLLFLDAADESLLRRFSETRRPHPLARESVLASVQAERQQLEPIRDLADQVIVTSGLTPAQLRKIIAETFSAQLDAALRISVISFGFRYGVPPESDLVFDVRFLPNPNYVPEFKALSGKSARVARYVRSFPQTNEFLKRLEELLTFLLPHFVTEGKTYLTITFGCTGGRHRSVMMAQEIAQFLERNGYPVRIAHRDIDKQ
ncbi:MAG: RNase adapter RapZ [Bryobacteraceae bacterium]